MSVSAPPVGQAGCTVTSVSTSSTQRVRCIHVCGKFSTCDLGIENSSTCDLGIENDDSTCELGS